MSKKIEFIMKMRDSAQMLADAANEYLKSMAPPELGLASGPATIDEATFATLKWDPQKGAQLGDFEVAHKASNNEAKWHHAYNILSASNATIKERYHISGYIYSYWIYGQ